MAELERVIKGLEVCFDSSKECNGCPYIATPYCKTTLCNDVTALLKEQEAKQVIRKQCKKEHDDGSIDYFAEWYCPHCNMLILRGFDNPSIKFCYKCGKPILWEGR